MFNVSMNGLTLNVCGISKANPANDIPYCFIVYFQWLDHNSNTWQTEKRKCGYTALEILLERVHTFVTELSSSTVCHFQDNTSTS
jgi:hypothetical protein